MLSLPIRSLVVFASATICAATTWTIDSNLDSNRRACPSRGPYKCTYRAALEAINSYDKLEPITIYFPAETFSIVNPLPSLMVTQVLASLLASLLASPRLSPLQDSPRLASRP
tara:strand:+ start:60 stop:398 length:339 start_codon:yes stop_codon:yes gene_type:complete